MTAYLHAHPIAALAAFLLVAWALYGVLVYRMSR